MLKVRHVKSALCFLLVFALLCTNVLIDFHGSIAKAIENIFESEKVSEGISTESAEIISQEEMSTEDIELGMQESMASASQDDAFTVQGTQFTDKVYSDPFKITDNVEEQVAYTDGSLVYTVTDFVLPGKNGLDLEIKRRYDSSKANYFEAIGEMGYTGSNQMAYIYYTYQNINLVKNNDGSMGNVISQTQNTTTAWRGNSDHLRYFTNYLNSLDNTYIYTDIINYGIYFPSAYNKVYTVHALRYQTVADTVFSIASGWTLTFSNIKILDDTKILNLSDGRSLKIRSGFENNLDFYTMNDIKLTYGNEYSLNSTASAYNVHYKDGKKEHFDSQGRLMAVVNRYGDKITFTYGEKNGRQSIDIIDSLNRVTSIYSEQTQNGLQTYVKLPENNQVIYGLSEAATYSSSYFPNDNGKKKYKLTSATDVLGKTCIYYYNDVDFRYNIGSRISSSILSQSSSTTQRSTLLVSIVYPSGKTSNYEYLETTGDWTNFGTRNYPELRERYDQIDDNRINDLKYTYTQIIETPVITPIIWRIVNILDNDRHLRIVHYLDMSPSQVKGAGWISKTESYSFNADENVWKLNAIENYEYFQYTPYRFYFPVVKRKEIKLYQTNQSFTSYENFEYDKYGNLLAQWSPLAQGDTTNDEYKTTYTYTQPYSLPASKTYKRDAEHTVTEVNAPTLDSRGIEWGYVYEEGDLKQKEQFSYDAFGNVTERKQYLLTGDDAVRTTYEYQNGAYLSRVKVHDVKDANGANLGAIAKHNTYDTLGRLRTETDANNNLYTYDYDSLGRLTELTNPDDSAKQYQYTDSTNTLQATDEEENTLIYYYDALGNLISVVDAQSGVTLKEYAYDTANRQISEKIYSSPTAYTETTTSYDHLDRVLEKKVLKDGSVLSHEQYTYEVIPASQTYKTTKTVVGEMDAPSVITVEYKDILGNVVQQGYVSGGVEYLDTYTYDYVGNRIQSLSAKDKLAGRTFTEKVEYNYANQPVKQTNVAGQFSTVTYDALGREDSSTDFKGNTSYYTYDNLGRLLTEKTPFETNLSGDILFSEKQYDYDAMGNVVSTRQSSNLPGASTKIWRQTDYTYNSRGFLLNTKQGNVYTLYQYDRLGNMTEQYTGQSSATPATNAPHTAYTYDRFGQMKTITDALGQEEEYEYDLAGNLTQKTDRNGAITANTYDGLGRLSTSAVTKNGQTTDSVSCDYYLTGQKKSESNEANAVTYTYYDTGLLASETERDGTKKTYTYDVQGNRTGYQLIVNNIVQLNTTYTYDLLSRLHTVTENGTQIAAYEYDANGNREKLSYPNGVTEEYTYNLANLVTSVTNATSGNIQRFDYNYYLDGNQESKHEKKNGTDVGKTEYQYDDLGRLVQEKANGGLHIYSYQYDKNNNRVQMTVQGPENYTTDYKYDGNNRLLSTVKTNTNTGDTETDTYTYDPNGNQLGRIRETLGTATASPPSLGFGGNYELSMYDGFNRLITVISDGKRTVYDYNPNGLRHSKNVGGSYQRHVWDGTNLSAEIRGDGTTLSTFVRGINLLRSTIEGTTQYYLYNAHGDVIQLADGTGAVTKTYAYDAFGVEQGLVEGDRNPFRYCAEYFDAETGQVYLRARYYQPVTGRFRTQDGWEYGNPQDPLSLNLYTYCGNNPVRFADPSGHIYIETLILIGSIVIGVIAAVWTAHNYWEYTRTIDWGVVVGMGLSWFTLAYSFGMTAYGVYLNYCAVKGIEPVTEVRFNPSASSSAGNAMQQGLPYKGTRNPNVDFTDKKGSTLTRHFDDHGESMKIKSETQYLSDARKFFGKNPTKTTLSFVSNEGTYFRYDKATNEFGIINKYGGISTYFKPKDGIDYWLDQIQKYAPK